MNMMKTVKMLRMKKTLKTMKMLETVKIRLTFMLFVT